MLQIPTKGTTWLFNPHKSIPNYLNTNFPAIPQSALTKGLRSKRQLYTKPNGRKKNSYQYLLIN